MNWRGTTAIDEREPMMKGRLDSVGVIAALSLAAQRAAAARDPFDGHPWAWAQPAEVLPDSRDQSAPRTPTAR
ncbi:hypothetical protein [Sinomonas sp. G460-2]|uniref:hypothetical protein n=1 Tax=Sinomonas sp. G460-2 TaxID=3393464 RepID=UPI0039F06123